MDVLRLASQFQQLCDDVAFLAARARAEDAAQAIARQREAAAQAEWKRDLETLTPAEALEKHGRMFMHAVQSRDAVLQNRDGQVA